MQLRFFWNSLMVTSTLLAFGTTSSASNLVVNGNFAAGDVGFTSAYTNVTPGSNGSSCVPEGVYDIVTSPSACHGAWTSFGPPAGNGSPNMMAINGASVAGVGVWSETVSVLANTKYYFSTAVASNYPVSPASLDFSINGVEIGSVFQASATPGLWQDFYATWSSGTNTTAILSIVNQNTNAYGNDFSLDGIAMDTVAPPGGTTVSGVPEPSSLLLTGVAAAVLFLLSTGRGGIKFLGRK